MSEGNICKNIIKEILQEILQEIIPTEGGFTPPTPPTRTWEQLTVKNWEQETVENWEDWGN